MGRSVTALALVAALALPALAQEPSLADLRAQLSGLRTELQALRSELVASGAAGFQAAGGKSAIDRMNAMEQRLMQLTDRTEQLQNRISRIVEDGTRRIADIEFRLCEMDETCDLASLTTPELGGLASGAANVAPSRPQAAPDAGGGSVPSEAEKMGFETANTALAAGDYARAAELFGQLAERHAGGPLTAQALYLRGLALDGAGNARGAAAAWLEAFAADPDGSHAADSLLGLARVIAADGDPVAACLYLGEIPARFPGTDAAAEAEQRIVALGCLDQGLGIDSDALPTPDLGGFDPESVSDLPDSE